MPDPEARIGTGKQRVFKDRIKPAGFLVIGVIITRRIEARDAITNPVVIPPGLKCTEEALDAICAVPKAIVGLVTERGIKAGREI